MKTSNEIDTEPPEYAIAHVSDFLDVPEDRIDDCLEEFKDYLEMARGIRTYVELIGESVDADEAMMELGKFTWIDDGKKNRAVTIKTEIGKTQT